MDKLIKKKLSQIKEKEKEVKKLKEISLYKKKEDKILQKLRQFKSKTKVSKKVSPPKMTKTNGLTKGLAYTGTTLAGLYALYRIYKLLNSTPNNNQPNNNQPIQMERI